MPEIIEKSKREVTYDIRFTEKELKFIVEVLGIQTDKRLIETHADCYDKSVSQFTPSAFEALVKDQDINYDLYSQLYEILEK